GWAGPVTHIDASALNISRAAVDAWDSQVDYAWHTERFGSFYWSAVGTVMKRLTRQVTSAMEPYDSVGYFDGPLEVRGQASFTWERGPWAVGWSTQYYDSHSV